MSNFNIPVRGNNNGNMVGNNPFFDSQNKMGMGSKSNNMTSLATLSPKRVTGGNNPEPV